MKKTVIILSALVFIAIVGVVLMVADIVRGNSADVFSRPANYQAKVENDSTHTEAATDSDDTRQPLDWDEIEWIGPEFHEDRYFDAIEWYYAENDLGERPFFGILPEFLDNIAAPGSFQMMPYYIDLSVSEVKTPSPQENFLNNLFCYVGRNNDLIMRLYKRLRPVVRKIYSETDYLEELDTYRYLNLLNISRSLFVQEEAATGWDTELLEGMYRYLNTKTNGVDIDHIVNFLAGYELGLPDFWDESEDRENLSAATVYDWSSGEEEVEDPDNDEPEYDPGYGTEEVYWAYSFWARRWHEGNIRAVSYILDDLLRMLYGNTPPVKYYEDVFTGEEIPRDAAGNSIYHYEYTRWYLWYDIGNATYIHSYRYDSEYRRTGEWSNMILRSDSTIFRGERWHMKEGVADGLYRRYNENKLVETVEYLHGSIIQSMHE